MESVGCWAWGGDIESIRTRYQEQVNGRTTTCCNGSNGGALASTQRRYIHAWIVWPDAVTSLLHLRIQPALLFKKQLSCQAQALFSVFFSQQSMQVVSGLFRLERGAAAQVDAPSGLDHPALSSTVITFSTDFYIPIPNVAIASSYCEQAQ
ncbi:hypothetical protein M422DRAFT_254037 [Sphaerobolus stellatus SS14]|uniref:Uncharacterized protein n=1 Tax=Sphaerobolus stellatus (strain SS14) TaxID=990650 RepID=A0A0C9V7F8_SPHS4|nr:hypothetical protein M422DRAFT_254037 [Sphaerobolus stellatus SS14]